MMLFAMELSDIAGPAVGGVVGAILMAAATAYTKFKRVNTESTVKIAEVEQKQDSATFREMQLMLRGATTRIAYQDGLIDEMRVKHALEMDEMRKIADGFREDIEECKSSRAALTERVAWLEGRGDNRTKSDAKNRPDKES